MVASLSRFIPKSACKSLPLFKLLKKEVEFEWTDQCQRALDELKAALTNPPIMTKPQPGETLYLYLAITDEAMSAVLVRESDLKQNPVYFISKVFQGPGSELTGFLKSSPSMFVSISAPPEKAFLTTYGPS